MGCGCACLGALIAMALPRAAMVAIYILERQWFTTAYETVVWPVLGFFFMPYTTLAYMAGKVNAGEIKDGWLILLIVAVVMDLSSWGSGGEAARRRHPD